MTTSRGRLRIKLMQNHTQDTQVTEIILRLAKNIKEHRVSRGLKQTDMGQFGFGYRWYQRLESGRHVPTLPTLIKLCRALNVEISDLFR